MRPDITMIWGDGTLYPDFCEISEFTIESAVFFRKHRAMSEFDRLVLALVSVGF